METGKTGKYFKYAIGEIVLVVIGILIALSINNWNETRKLSNIRTSLINDLITDFEVTANNLDSIKLQIYKRNTFTGKFNKAIYVNKDYTELDSLRNNIDKFFETTVYSVSLTSYKNAESSGSISLLKDKEILYLFSKFLVNHEEIKKIDINSNEMYYSGPFWDLRKELGSVYVLIDNKVDTDKDFTDILNKKVVQSTFEIINELEQNRHYFIKLITSDIEKILARLYCLRDDNCDTQKT